MEKTPPIFSRFNDIRSGTGTRHEYMAAEFDAGGTEWESAEKYLENLGKRWERGSAIFTEPYNSNCLKLLK